MNLCKIYNPINLSELEIEYPKIIEYLNTDKTFIVNGPKYSGKSTIIKLYLKLLNYDYLYIDDFNISKEKIIDKIQYKTKSVFSYFYNKKYIIVIDNFDLFEKSIKDLILKHSNNSQFIIITNRYLDFTIKYVRINKYSHDYLINLYTIIYFLETNTNSEHIPCFENINQMYSQLEFILNLKSNASNASNASDKNKVNNNNNFILFDNFNYKFNDLVSEKDFTNKIYILNSLSNYSIFQYNLLYNYNNLDDLVNSYENLSTSLYMFDNLYYSNMEYYSILSMIGTSYTLKSFNIYTENIQIRKKKNFKNNYY